MEKHEFNTGTIYLGDCAEIIPEIGKFDHVITDPPYGYLDHKIETFFDYEDVFTKIRAGIKPAGGILIFGRGDLFFKWNLYLAELGFIHREDCIYNKTNPPSMVLPMIRYGEYFTIRALKGFKINKVYIPIEDEANVSEKRLASWLKQCKGDRSGRVFRYLQTGEIEFDQENKTREKIKILRTDFKTAHHAIKSIQSLIKGIVMGNVVNAPRELLDEGSHPTIKNHATIRYLVKAISSEGQTILDPFLGSGTTALACAKEGRRFIGIEKDKEYFELSCRRIEKYESENLFI